MKRANGVVCIWRWFWCDSRTHGSACSKFVGVLALTRVLTHDAADAVVKGRYEAPRLALLSVELRPAALLITRLDCVLTSEDDNDVKK